MVFFVVCLAGARGSILIYRESLGAHQARADEIVTPSPHALECGLVVAWFRGAV